VTITITTRRATLALISVCTLGACARAPQPGAVYVRAQPAPDPPPPPAPTLDRAPEAMAAGSIHPAPGQLKLLPGRAPAPSAATKTRPSALQLAADANHKASQAPDRSDYFNAIVQYSYEPGTLYQVYAQPMRITDVALEPGEKILGQPASGDVVRWLLALGKSMDRGGVEQWHVYLKPTRPDLETNLAINTDRRSYLLELHSYESTYMAAIVWRYPQDELARLQAQASELAAAQKNAAPVAGVDALNFNYTIQVVSGTPSWTPVQVFDDGRRTFLRFPAAMVLREAPALFVLRDSQTQLVNYRVKNDTYVIDRLIDAAELRVGQKDQEIVRIVRASPEPVRPVRTGSSR
jgi:P-type conjugative transfer protein TrbG